MAHSGMNKCPECPFESTCPVCFLMAASDLVTDRLPRNPKVKMTPAQYADFMAKHAKAGKRTNQRRKFFRGPQ